MWSHSALPDPPVEAECPYLENIIVSSFCSVSITRQRNSTTYRLQICAPGQRPMCIKNKTPSTYDGNVSVACRRRAAKVATCSPFRDVLKPLDLDCHCFLEEWPHLQTKSKEKCLQWLTTTFLNLAHDFFRQPDHYEEGDYRWQRLQCSLRKCLHFVNTHYQYTIVGPNLRVIQGWIHDLLPDGIQSSLVVFRELWRLM